MQISEVAEITKLSKKAIRLYIEENLIFPDRKENNYQEFKEADVKRLLAIKKLRDLGISIQHIKLMFNAPNMIPLILSQQKVYLMTEAKHLESQLCSNASLLNNFIQNPAVSFDECIIRSIDTVDSALDPNRAINPLEAEMMLGVFWSIFSVENELNEFQLFLWSQLKNAYLRCDSPELKQYRNLIYDQGKNLNLIKVQEQQSSHFRYIYKQVSMLKHDDLKNFVLKKCEEIQEKLCDKDWVKLWFDGQKYTQVISVAFSEEISCIMCQFSPSFAAYHDNMVKINQIFYNYCISEQGSIFRQTLQSVLCNSCDIAKFDHVVQLFFFFES